MDPLSQLRDLHLPDAPASWPPAPGWWVLMALGLALIAAGLYLYLRWRKTNAYRRAALAALKDLDLASDTLVLDALQLVRQTALSTHGASPLATLPGPKLVLVLDQFSGGELSRLLGSGGPVTEDDLNHLLYGDPNARLSDEQKRTLLKQIQVWIRKHRRESLC